MPALLCLTILASGGASGPTVVLDPAILVAMQPHEEEDMVDIEPLGVDEESGTPWGAIGLHYGIGVMATAGGLAASYGLGVWVGHSGNGLAPPLIGLLIGALIPPLIITTAQWGIWELTYENRDRYWPALITAFACHLAIFVGSVLGGISLHDNSGVAVILLESLALPAATTATAYLTRYRRELQVSHARAAPPGEVRISVPLLKGVF